MKCATVNSRISACGESACSSDARIARLLASFPFVGPGSVSPPFHLSEEIQMRMSRILVTLAFGLLSTSMFGQGLTVGAVIIGAKSVEDSLNTVVGNAGAEGRSVVNGANGTLNGAIQQLQQLVNNDLSKQVNTLSDTGQALAKTIQNTTDELNTLINIRVTCGFEGADRLVYGVKTITSQLQNAIPFIKDAQPYVYSFKFNGHSDGVVPDGGGRLVISGFSLWNKGVGPDVILVDENRKEIKALPADHANDDNSVSVSVDDATLKSLAGRCAEFEVVPKQKKGFGPFGHVEAEPARFLPMCVPPTENLSFRVKAHTDFKCTKDLPTQTMNYQNFRCDNSSCEHDAACNVQKAWTIPTGCTVVGLAKRPSEVKNNSSMNITYIGGNVVANGTIDSASCVNAAFVHHLDHSTIWSWDAAPQISCAADSWVPSELTSEPLAISSGTIPVCVDLPRPCDTTNTVSTAEIDLMAGAHEHYSPADTVPVSAVTTPKLTLSSNVSGNFIDIDTAGMTLKGTVNPAAGPTVQTCVTVAVQRCGY